MSSSQRKDFNEITIGTDRCPEKFLCTLTKKIMNNPVTPGDGFYYEEKAIREHFQKQLDEHAASESRSRDQINRDSYFNMQMGIIPEKFKPRQCNLWGPMDKCFPLTTVQSGSYELPRLYPNHGLKCEILEYKQRNLPNRIEAQELVTENRQQAVTINELQQRITALKHQNKSLMNSITKGQTKKIISNNTAEPKRTNAVQLMIQRHDGPLHKNMKRKINSLLDTTVSTSKKNVSKHPRKNSS